MSDIAVVTEADLPDLLPLMRAYCDFYGSNPSTESLRQMSLALIADPDHEGVQLIARDSSGAPAGFATIFWTWSTNSAARVGTMNDLFVAPQARGTGLAEELIRECVELARKRGAIRLEWQTALDNHRAQAVYERVGGKREQWLDYSLPTGAS
jgi:GNAT superfamily N-acetyltransferase